MFSHLVLQVLERFKCSFVVLCTDADFDRVDSSPDCGGLLCFGLWVLDIHFRVFHVGPGVLGAGFEVVNPHFPVFVRPGPLTWLLFWGPGVSGCRDFSGSEVYECLSHFLGVFHGDRAG